MLKKAAEANKKGKRLPEFDDKGELINPYIPMYISKAPCMKPLPISAHPYLATHHIFRVHEGRGRRSARNRRSSNGTSKGH